LINFTVKNQGIENVIGRPLWIEVENRVGIITCMFEKILRVHRYFAHLFVTLAKFCNQHGRRLIQGNCNVVSNLKSSTGERMNGHDFAVVKPKPDRGIELTLDCVLARYLQHYLSVPVVTSLFTTVLPLRFPLQNLRARNRHYFRSKLFEPLERCFFFGRLGLWHDEILGYSHERRKP
jgi:hypothetical protein